MMQELDRRTFVMGSFGFGMAVLGGGALAGCAAEPVSELEADRTSEPEVERPSPASSDAPEAPETPVAPAGKALVVVFSHLGNTLQVAERIAQATGVDLFRVETTDVWPEDYDAMTSQVQREQNEGYLPPITTGVEDWASYDTVYLGHPIWWGHLPHVMRSFLLQHDLTGKTVAPFCTSGSSGIEGALKDVRALYPDANLLAGLAITRSSLPGALESVEPWLDGLDLA